MKYSTAFGDWTIGSDDTATDLHNRLMWTRRYLGKHGVGVGEMYRAGWILMTEQHGRGVMAYERSSENKLGPTVQATYAKTGHRYGFTSGRKTVRHAGYSDWRLPTLEEVVTISFEEGWGAKKIASGIDDPLEIISTIFDKSCEQQRFWTANMCWQQKEFRMLFGLKPTLSPVAWCFGFEMKTSIMDIGGDPKPHEYGALLVRRT